MEARMSQEAVEFAYKNYIAESLYHQVRNEGLTIHFHEMFEQKPKRSGDEIAQDIIKRAGLTVKGGEA